jgi:hypothetical protein
MKLKTNREIEEYYFKLFSKVYNNLPTGEVIYSDKPDVIIKNDRRQVGIEITNLYLEDGSLIQSEQRQRNLRELTLSKAHQKYLSDGGKNINIGFGFDTDHPITDLRYLIKKMVQLVKSIENKQVGEVLKNTFSDIHELDYVYLISTENENPKWTVCQVYTGQIISFENLLNKINEKEMKSEEYQPCDEYWLLLIIDFFDRAQDQAIIIDNFPYISSKTFSKIIIYKTIFDEISEVKVSKVLNL